MKRISVRIPDELKAKIKDLGVNGSERIRRFIEGRIEEEEKEKALREMHRLLTGGAPAGRGTGRKYVSENRDNNGCLFDSQIRPPGAGMEGLKSS